MADCKLRIGDMQPLFIVFIIINNETMTLMLYCVGVYVVNGNMQRHGTLYA